MNQRFQFAAFLMICCLSVKIVTAQKAQKQLAVIAYYAGDSVQIDNFDINKITHVIFSFCHLKGNRLSVANARDTATIKKLVSKKQENPSLKVMLSLGGWGGCKECSAVFNTKDGRKEVAASVKELLDYFQADGIDLDWEYPAIEGFPGHQYLPADKTNFTALVKQLRKKLGKHKLISFAAGGFSKYLENSIEWKKVLRKADFVNLMTYDLISGFSKVTGHHTPLYSTSSQVESIDHAVTYLTSIGISPHKLAIGAAFYGRVFDSVANINNGLYQPARFKAYVPSKLFPDVLSTDKGFVYYWDHEAKAPYCYNPVSGTFATFDNTRSMALKTKYAIDKKLYGIMFWQLTEDTLPGGVLLTTIDEVRKGKIAAE
jgi:chitinase